MNKSFQLYFSILIVVSFNFSCKKKVQQPLPKDTTWEVVQAANGFKVLEGDCIVTFSDILCLGNNNGFRRIDCKTNKFVDEINIIQPANNGFIPDGFNKLFQKYYVAAEPLGNYEFSVCFYDLNESKIYKTICNSNIFIPQNRGFSLSEIYFAENLIPLTNMQAIVTFNNKDSMISSLLDFTIGNYVYVLKNNEHLGVGHLDRLIQRYQGDLILNYFSPKDIKYYSRKTNSTYATFFNYEKLFTTDDTLFCVKQNNGQYDIYTSIEGESWDYLNTTKESFDNTYVVDNKLVKVEQNKILIFNHDFTLKNITREGLPNESGKIIASQNNWYYICDAGVYCASKSKLF